VNCSVLGHAAFLSLTFLHSTGISIGIALVGQPKILIMDEPLSGLDSVNAQRVIQALRSMASGPENGTSIIMTVHQPSSQIFEAFDRVMLMSQGQMLFDGAPSETVQWCEAHGRPVPLNHNPADHLLTIAFSDMANNPNATSDKSGVPALSSLTTPFHSNKPVATLLTQVQCLARRAFLDAWRDRSGVLAHILGSVAVALITGAAFYKVNLTIAGFQNRVGSIFFLLLLITFAALSAMTILHRTRPLVVRERGNGLYTPFSWLLSHLIVSTRADCGSSSD
jgi:ABC-2 type transporter